MRRNLCLALCVGIVGFFAWWAEAVEAPAAKVAATTRPAVGIYVVPGMRAPAASNRPAGPDVILEAWEDGQIVWSLNANGGPPYLMGRFDPKRLTELTEDLGKRGAFEDKALAQARYGPDSSYILIRIEKSGQRLELRSWHELFEQNSKLVATDRGITSLNGRDREEVLAKEPAEYRAYRATWKEIRTATKGWIPETGQECVRTAPVE